jgi:hypothetical protein
MPALVFRNADTAVYAGRVIHGAFPALAWRVEMGGKRIVFSGDTNGEGEGLTKLEWTRTYSSLTTPCRRELPEWKDVSICHLRSSERPPGMLT